MSDVDDGRPRRECPFCWNMILRDALVCRFCGHGKPAARPGMDTWGVLKILARVVFWGFIAVPCLLFALNKKAQRSQERQDLINPPPPRRATPLEIENDERDADLERTAERAREAADRLNEARKRATRKPR